MKRFSLLILAFVSMNLCAQKVKLPDLPKHRSNYTDFEDRETGYWSAIDINASSTVLFKRSNMQNIGAEWINGYRFNEFLKVGIGVGAHYYLNNNNLRTDDVAWSFPLFIDVRGNINSQQDRGSVPYWAVDLGGEIHGGVYFSPTLGYRFGTQRGSFLIGVSYTFQQHDTWKKENENISGVSFKFGYEF